MKGLRCSHPHHQKVEQTLAICIVYNLLLVLFFVFQPNVTGLILAGSADFKSELSQSDMFDQVSLEYVISMTVRIFNLLLCVFVKHTVWLHLQSLHPKSLVLVV